MKNYKRIILMIITSFILLTVITSCAKLNLSSTTTTITSTNIITSTTSDTSSTLPTVMPTTTNAVSTTTVVPTTSYQPSTTTALPTTIKPTLTTTSTTTTSSTTFDDYGFDVITVSLSKYSISYTGLYTSKEEVGAYIYTYKKLPSNFKKKNDFSKSDYTSENKLSTGGDQFYNREGILPSANKRTYTECDIDYTGGNRGSKRIVYSSDFLIFYTSDHYESFKIMQFI